MGWEAGTTILEISLAVPQKIGPRYTTPGHIHTHTHNAPTYNKDTCSTMFIAALFIIGRGWKELRCPSTEEWIQKMEYYSVIKNNKFMKFLGKWMQPEEIMLSEVPHTNTNSHDVHSLISGY
jgi:hypothetical protein